jgi:hypothetical protein
LVTEVGCLRFVRSVPYRAISPHSGALLQQQQMHTLRSQKSFIVI